jgi:hypothetical protein
VEKNTVERGEEKKNEEMSFNSNHKNLKLIEKNNNSAESNS